MSNSNPPSHEEPDPNELPRGSAGEESSVVRPKRKRLSTAETAPAAPATAMSAGSPATASAASNSRVKPLPPPRRMAPPPPQTSDDEDGRYGPPKRRRRNGWSLQQFWETALHKNNRHIAGFALVFLLVCLGLVAMNFRALMTLVEPTVESWLAQLRSFLGGSSS